MKKLIPTGSYEVQLPNQIESQQDDRVSSFWSDGEPLLLQLSSYVRTDGEQVSAKQRLEDRIAKTSGTRTDVPTRVNEHAPDQAAVEVLDANGISWLHTYLVWPHLAIYASLSGPEGAVHNNESWARLALKTLALRLVPHSSPPLA